MHLSVTQILVRIDSSRARNRVCTCRLRNLPGYNNDLCFPRRHGRPRDLLDAVDIVVAITFGDVAVFFGAIGGDDDEVEVVLKESAWLVF